MNAARPIARLIPLLFATSLPALVAAQETGHRLGEHPAVIVKRMSATQGYDYAAKFYPHPAWMYLSSEAPRPMMQHPAVIVAERERQRRAEEERAAKAAAQQLIVSRHR